jgi:hypothetical protein
MYPLHGALPFNPPGAQPASPLPNENFQPCHEQMVVVCPLVSLAESSCVVEFQTHLGGGVGQSSVDADDFNQ